jgi:hypothetical protein
VSQAKLSREKDREQLKLQASLYPEARTRRENDYDQSNDSFREELERRKIQLKEEREEKRRKEEAEAYAQRQQRMEELERRREERERRAEVCTFFFALVRSFLRAFFLYQRLSTSFGVSFFGLTGDQERRKELKAATANSLDVTDIIVCSLSFLFPPSIHFHHLARSVDPPSPLLLPALLCAFLLTLVPTVHSFPLFLLLRLKYSPHLSLPTA